MSNNGYEYALTLLVVTLALTVQGAGRFALDNALLAYFDNKKAS
jgi:putative oxidoreductase